MAAKGSSRLDRRDVTTIAGMSGVVAALHVVGWGSLLLVVVPGNFEISKTEVFGVGVGLTAYVLGLRHAFDADHIAAIDNTTRKMMAEGTRPLSSGFWFALGHSTVVFVLCLLLALGVRALAGPVADESSALRSATGLVGGLVSGVFLVLIGVINLLVLRQIVGVLRKMRSGRYDDYELERHLNDRGLLARLLRGVVRRVRKPGHMYPLGLLFGLGFDTATEVSLLVLAGGAAAGNLPWYAILTLPVLFTAGMTLLDGINGCVMNFAYGWSIATPVRKVFYNLTITGLSVAVALLIGGIQLLGLLAERLDIVTGPLAWLAELDLGSVGFAVAGLIVATWLVSVAWWRLGRLERRWSSEPES
ncbi:MAG: HoxN/HupN/NixA family nickel/cobalt transporter [Actinophytocola sp.]|nr:HoxN/HupN/NixA family nickel/cobalt transporter [Actinophytocola sp.]